MSLWDSIRRVFVKESQARTVLAFNEVGKPIQTPRDYANLSKEGYMKQVVSYRCINLIADSATQVPILLFEQQGKQKQEIMDHPALALMDQPNPMQPGALFLESFLSYYLISGNAYLEGSNSTGNPTQPPKELWTVPSNFVKVVGGENGLPAGYVVSRSMGNEVKFPVDQLGRSNIMHMKTFSPLDLWYGMSPLEAVALDIDQLNAMGFWNLSLLQNSARPSGAFSMKIDKDHTGELTDDQRRQLRTDIDDHYSGPARAGRPMLLEGGLQWQSMGLTPVDMDFINSKKVSTQDVARAYGVPGQLLGIEGSQTFANFEQARQFFYLDTVIPIVQMYADMLNAWLLPKYGENKFFFGVDKDGVEALAPLRRDKWTQVQAASWMTTNEKREATGFGRYSPTEDAADKILVGSGLIPLEVAAEDLEPNEPPPMDEPDEEPEDNVDQPDDGDENPDNVDNPEDNSEDEEPPKGSQVAVMEGKLFNLRNRAQRARFAALQVRRRKALERAFTIQVRAVFRKQMNDLMRSLDGIRPELLEFTINEALDQSGDDLQRVLAANMKRSMELFGSDVLDLGKMSQPGMETKGVRDKFEDFLSRFIATEAFRKVADINRVTSRTLLSKLRKVVTEQLISDSSDGNAVISIRDVEQTIRSTFTTFTKSRAIRIARTETHNASMAGSLGAAKATGVDMLKEWVPNITGTSRGARPGDTTNHIKMEGVKVPINEKFEVWSHDGMDLMDAPGDTSAPADQIINCGCVLTYTTNTGGE